MEEILRSPVFTAGRFVSDDITFSTHGWPHQVLMDSSNLIVKQMALHMLSGSQNKTKPGIWKELIRGWVVVDRYKRETGGGGE